MSEAVDFLPPIRAELEADDAVGDLAGDRIANHEAEPGWVGSGPTSWRTFVVLVDLGAVGDTRTPRYVQRILARCFGRTPREAFNVYAAVRGALHNRGPRTSDFGERIYSSREDAYQGVSDDPGNRQPVAEAIFVVVGATLIPA